jgi:hypothetical protein
MTRQRDLRKEDLLLASRLARGQVMGAVAELGEGADAIADRVQQLRRWLSSPWVWAAGGAGALVLGVALRRVSAVSVLRWGWLALRLWRAAVPALRAPVHYRTTGGHAQWA